MNTGKVPDVNNDAV